MRNNLSLLPKIVIAFVLVLFPSFLLIEYTAGRILEDQVIKNINATLKIYTIKEGKALDKLFEGYVNLGKMTSEFLHKALSEPLPPEALDEFDRNYTLIKGAIRTDIAVSPDKDISGVFISNLTKLNNEIKKEVVASGREFLPYAKAAINEVFDTYYISKNQFIRIYEKNWALEIDANHDFTKDAFFYLADPKHNPERIPVWTPPYHDSILKHWMISIIVPIYEGDNFMGLAGHDVVLDRIYKDVLDKKNFKTGYSFIFDSDKNIIIHPHYLEQLEKNTAIGTEIKEHGLANVISRTVKENASGNSYAQYTFYEKNSKFFCYVYRLNFLNWYLASVIPQDELVEMLPSFMKKITVGAIVCGILIFGLVILIVWFYVLSPLKKISKATEIIGRGNLEHKIKIGGNDELGKLASSFNSMVLRLRDREEQLNSRSEELKKTNAELTKHKENLQKLVEAQTKELKEQNSLLENRMMAYQHLVNDMKAKLDTVGDAIRIIDKNYSISYVNKSFLDMYGLENDKDVIGKKCYEIFQGDACHTDNCPLRQILSGKEKLEMDVRRQLLNGEDKIFILGVRPYYSADGDVIGIMEVFKDITVRSELQEMAERNAQHLGRIEMANNVLHDIGNALTGISACMLKPQTQKDWVEIKSLHQLKDLFVAAGKDLAAAFGEDKNRKLVSFIDALIASFEKRSASYTEFFEKISCAVGHISSVLDLQRHYMKGKSTPLASAISLKNLIEDTLVMLAGSQEKRNIKVKMNFNGENPKVSGDQTRLIRVFLNIMKNIYEAFDASGSAEPKMLSINVESDHEKNEVTLVFVDNACGFSPELAEKLFERGFTTKEKGSGIGLRECRSVIESHGGSIKIESKGENTGATLTIKLPLLKTKQGE